MADYHQANDDQNKAILQKVKDDSQDPEITAIIGCYTIGAKGTDIRKLLNKHKIDPLKKSAVYLGIYPKGDTQKGKPAIITDIIRRLNSLLMDLCGVCGDYFHTELNETPLFKCLICHQGCHTKCFQPIDTMFRQLDATHRRAIQFICTSCHSDHNEDEEDTEITVNAPKVKKSPSKAEPAAKVPDSVAAEEQRSDNNDHSKDPDHFEIHTHPPPLDDSSNIKVQVCPRYRWGRCPEFETCEFRHPPRCWSWLETGRCSYKAKCRYHHPPLCDDSLNNRQCFNAECRYFHLKRTLRHRMEDEHLKDSLHAANYHTQMQQSQSSPTAAHYSDQPHIVHAQQNNSAHQNQPSQPHIFHAQQTIPVHQSKPPQPPQAPSGLNRHDMSFLLQTIRGIKDELGREIAELKGNINAQNRPQITTTNSVPQPVITTPNSVPQPITTPNLYNIPNLMLPVHPQSLYQR